MSSLGSISVYLDCKVVSEPHKINSNNGVEIYQCTVQHKRRSGVIDEFYINFHKDYLCCFKVGYYLNISGDLRSLNSLKVDGGIIQSSIFVYNVTVLDSEPEDYINYVNLKNCSLFVNEPLRKSSDGKNLDVISFKIKLTGKYDRICYLECTAWRDLAVFVNKQCRKGVLMNIEGRLQSSISNNNSHLYVSLVVTKLKKLF